MDEAIDDPPLRRLGRYRLCFEVASGGMASVYVARQESDAGFEKIVAVKVVHRHLANEEGFTAMFLDEARLAARIDHPHVCSVFDFGQVGGVYYLAMEYLLGESLLHVAKEVARRKQKDELARLPWLVARVFADACEGLHAAHDLTDEDGELLGVVHRDVTPQNLILTYDGSVKVVDFGVAKAASQLHKTEAGKIKGKLAYVSPEQLANKPIDRRTDVWALGVCLWEMLTLKRLFRRDNDAATLMAVAHDPIPLPSEVRSWIPPDLDEIVMGALCRDLDVRTPSARELGRELSRFLTSSGVSVGMPELAEWMQSMFAEQRAERRDLIRRARTADVSVPLALPSGETSSTDSVAASVSLEVPLRPPEPAPAAPRATEVVPAARRNPWLGVLVAAALVVAGGGGYYAARIAPEGVEPEALEASVAPREASSVAAPPPEAPPSPTPPTEPVPDVIAAPPPEELVVPPDEPVAPPDEPVVPPDDPVVETAPSDPVDHPPPSEPPGSSSRRRRVPREESEATPSAPAPAPAASGTGHVVVLASGGGWAEVHTASRSLGRTPLRVPLPAGTHRLRILPNGQEPAHFETVTVERGEDVLLRVRIQEP